MEGYLFKWTNFIKGWTIRYFLLNKHILYYSKQKGDDEKNAIHLKIAKVIPEKNKKSFVIDTGTNKIYLKANSEEERDIWISAISNEINILNHSLASIKEDNKHNLTEDVFDKITKANAEIDEKKKEAAGKVEENIILENKENLISNSEKNTNNNQNNLNYTSLDFKNNIEIPDEVKNLISFDKANYEDNNKLILNQIEDFTKLIQNFQNSYFALSMGLENINLAFMKNKSKEDLKKLYLDLVSVKQDFKVNYALLNNRVV